MKKITLLFITALVLPLFSLAAAQESAAVQTDYAVSQLVAEKTTIAPGETVTFLFDQKLKKDWHVYWKNPGDSGLPLALNWTLPEGFVAGEPAYPVPEVIPVDIFVNYGFKDRAGFLIDVTAPDNIAPGEEVAFKVKADWLICELICVPEFAEFDLTLPVSDGPGEMNSQWALRFREVRETMPQPADFEAVWFIEEGKPGLHIKDQRVGDQLYFFVEAINLVEPSAPQIFRRTVHGDPVLQFKPGFDFDAISTVPVSGVLQTASGKAVQLVAKPGPVPELAPLPAQENGQGEKADVKFGGLALWSILLLAFLGGIILNVMPCVFPVIFIKAASLAKSAEAGTATVRRHGLIYTGGILVAFAAIAGLLLVLRAGGAELGWGFQLQSPVANMIFALIIFLIGLNLAGLFEMGTSLQGVGAGLASKGGNKGSFFTGLLVVAVAAPCIGPLLGLPVGYALSASTAPVMGLAVFLLMGLGVALPYLLLSLVPGLAKLLPRPGQWMQSFKQFLSFAMFATLVWLAWVIIGQAGEDAVVLLGSALVLAAIAAWSYGKRQRGGGRLWLVLAVIAMGLSLWSAVQIKTQPMMARGAKIEAGEGTGSETSIKTPWSQEKVDELREAGVPVFIDFTAKWCVTCQVNEVTVLNRREIVQLFKDKSIAFLVADWTSYDPEITRALESYGRSGVPLYVYYAPGAKEPQILPQILSIDLMKKTFAAL